MTSDTPSRETVLERLEAWACALESGEYEQGVGGLRVEGGRRYCCLGVACEVYRRLTGEGSWEFTEEGSYDENFVVGDEKDRDYLPPRVARFFGVSPSGAALEFLVVDGSYFDDLSAANDSGQVPFSEVARILREKSELILRHDITDEETSR